MLDRVNVLLPSTDNEHRNTTMLTDSAFAFSPAALDGKIESGLTSKFQGRECESVRRVRVREPSDHLESPDDKRQKMALDATLITGVENPTTCESTNEKLGIPEKRASHGDPKSTGNRYACDGPDFHEIHGGIDNRISYSNSTSGGRSENGDSVVLSALRFNLPTSTGRGDQTADPRFKHKSATDIDVIDLPKLGKKCVSEMSAVEVVDHFKALPLSGIEISDHLTGDQRNQMQRFLIENRDLFALDPKRPGLANTAPMTIDTGDAQPRAFPHRSTMPHMRPLVEEHIKSMLKYGIIRHSESPWAAAVLMVPKKREKKKQSLENDNCAGTRNNQKMGGADH